MPPADPALVLPDVTLVAVTSVAREATARALALSLDRARFGHALWLSDESPPDALSGRIEWRPIAPIGSRQAYSRFMLGELHRHVATRHALCVQWDGYVLNPESWDPAFGEFDYIGAPWPQFAGAHTVGNGGFSLRSRRLLEACAELPIRAAEAEDVAICRVHRTLLEERFGLRFAPPALAQRFAHERIPPAGPSFGFHGVFNLVRQTAPRQAATLIAGLEPQVMARNEHREILAWALRRGHWRLAWTVARRWRRLLAQTNES